MHKHGEGTQLLWHTRNDGRAVVAGAYHFPDDERWPAKRRGTTPTNGGTDTLQPQCVGLLAQLLRGELPGMGKPDIIYVEACARAKVR